MLFDIIGISLIEQFSERCFVRERHAEDLQDLIGRAFQLQVMLDNRHETVGSDGSTDLYSDSILRSAPELFDLEVLLEPLEEQLYLPSVLVEVGYLLGSQVHRIGQEHELSV